MHFKGASSGRWVLVFFIYSIAVIGLKPHSIAANHHHNHLAIECNNVAKEEKVISMTGLEPLPLVLSPASGVLCRWTTLTNY